MSPCPIGEGVPMAEHFSAVSVAPHEVEAALFGEQPFGARTGLGKSPRQLEITPDEIHPIDSGDGGAVEARRLQDRWKRTRGTEAVREIRQSRFLVHPIRAQPLLADEEITEGCLSVR